jgi:hypothetical protein
LDEAAIYDHALTPADVIDHYLAGGHGGIRLEGDVGGLPGLSSAHVLGLAGANQTLALQIQPGSASRGIEFAGIQMRNFVGTVASSGGSGVAFFNGELWLPQFSANSALGQGNAVLTKTPTAGNFTLRLAQGFHRPLAGFDWRFETLTASGVWSPVGQASATVTAGGTLIFPRGAGEAHFDGDIDTLHRRFTFNSHDTVTLWLAGQRFSASETATLTEKALTVGGDLKLGSRDSDRSMHVNLKLEPAAGMIFSANGNTGWVGFPLGSTHIGTHGWLDWNGTFAFDTDGHFNSSFGGTFYGSTPQHPDDRTQIPDGETLAKRFWIERCKCYEVYHTIKLPVGPFTIGTDGTGTVSKTWNGEPSFPFTLR